METLALEAGAKVVRRPVIRDHPDGGMLKHPEPLPAITAAHLLEVTARDFLREQARFAREDGCGWAAIAGALGLAGDEDQGVTPGEAAFEEVTYADDAFAATVVFRWTCQCGGIIRDHGPDAGHPADAEEGHAEDCERFRAAIEAYEAEGDDGGLM